MQNRRELITRRIELLTGQANAARQAGSRVDLIEAQIDGWTEILRMFDAGKIATSPRVLVIMDSEIEALDKAMESTQFPDLRISATAHVLKRLREAHFVVEKPLLICRLPEGGTEFRQEPMLP